jgi:hypothetical protein
MSPETAAVLDPRTVVRPDPAAPLWDGLLRDWPDPDAARRLLAGMHEREVERASRSPVINVTIPGVGRFSTEVGSGLRTWTFA